VKVHYQAAGRKKKASMDCITILTLVLCVWWRSIRGLVVIKGWPTSKGRIILEEGNVQDREIVEALDWMIRNHGTGRGDEFGTDGSIRNA